MPNKRAEGVHSITAVDAGCAATTERRRYAKEQNLIASRALLAILCICFLIGGGFHICDNLVNGFLPYTFVPLPINIYWTLLAALDLITVFVLIKRLRLGLLLALLIMLTDVGTNSYVFYGLGVFGNPIGLQLQSVFLGFSVAASMALWNSFRPLRISA